MRSDFAPRLALTGNVTPERFKQIEEAFQRARDLPPAERTAFLERLCADDPDLHAEVTSLLASEPEAALALHRAIAGALTS